MLRKIVVAYLLLLSAIAPWVLMLALPFVDLGVFRQVETISAALHVLAALSALGLMAFSAAFPGKLPGFISSPVAVLAGLGVALALITPFAVNPWMNLHGSLELGVGALWHIEVALLAVAMTVSWQQGEMHRLVLALSSALPVAIASVLQIMGLKLGAETMVVYDFSEWLGPAAMLAVVPLLALRRPAATVAGILLVVVGLAVSGNRAAIVATVVFVATWMALRLMRRHRPVLQGVVASVAALAAMIALLSAPPLLEQLASSHPLVPKGDIASVAPIDLAAVQNQPYGTLWQRGVNMLYLANDMTRHPWSWLSGTGFGSFERAIAEQGLWPAGRQFELPTPTSSATYWDGALKAKFHSHNILLEILSAGGVLAGMGWLLFVGLVAASGDRARLAGASMLTAVLVVVGSLWFLPNSMAPFLALGLATLVVPAENSRRSSALDNIASIVLMIAALAFAVLAAIGLTAIGGERNERAFVPLPSVVCQGYEALGMPNMQINGALYRILLTRLENMDDDRREVYTAMNVNNLRNFSCIHRKAADEGDMVALRDSLLARGRVIRLFAGDPAVAAAVMSVDIQHWGDDLKKMLQSSPHNDFLVLPYMSWLAKVSDRDRERDELSRLAADLLDTSPVKAYAQARLAALRGDGVESSRFANLALDLGLANLIPLSAEQAMALRGTER